MAASSIALPSAYCVQEMERQHLLPCIPRDVLRNHLSELLFPPISLHRRTPGLLCLQYGFQEVAEHATSLLPPFASQVRRRRCRRSSFLQRWRAAQACEALRL